MENFLEDSTKSHRMSWKWKNLPGPWESECWKTASLQTSTINHTWSRVLKSDNTSLPCKAWTTQSKGGFHHVSNSS